MRKSLKSLVKLCIFVQFFVLLLLPETVSAKQKKPVPHNIPTGPDIYEEDYEDPFEELDEPVSLDEAEDESAGTTRFSRASPGSVDSEGGGTAGNAAGTPRITKPLKPEDNISFGPVDKQNFYPEMAALLLFIVYVINFFVGKAKNQQLAFAWLRNFKPLFQRQFSAVGIYEQDVPGLNPAADVPGLNPAAEGAGLIQDSQSCYKLYASGRRFCTCLLATIELRKRQDLFSLMLEFVDLSPSKDLCTLEIPMSDTMEPFVFAIMRKRDQKRLRREQKDLENYAGLVTSPLLNKDWSILTDCPELEADFVDERVANLLHTDPGVFEVLHFTDQNSDPNCRLGKKILRFQFQLPINQDQIRATQKFLAMAFHFIDCVATQKLSAQARESALKKRRKVSEKMHRATHAQRQEAHQRRKEEMKRREEEQLAAEKANLSEAALRKKEAREYNKAFRKKQPRVKLIR
eukprot:g35595.t1